MLLMVVAVILECLLCGCALLGDLLAVTIPPTERVARALLDNATHAVIGGITWAAVCTTLPPSRRSPLSQELIQIVSCTLLASIIDLDHFLAAGSLKLQDATNLSERPMLHSTSLILASGVLLILLSVSHPFLHPWGWIWLAATLSHHTRDAVRRGYSFHPFGETTAISKYMYLLILALIPQVITGLMIMANIGAKHHTSDIYVQMV